MAFYPNKQFFNRQLFLYFSGQVDKNHQTYTDDQLEQLLEYVFEHTDLNKDGYVDYLEYRISDFKAKRAEKEKEVLPKPNKKT